MGTEDSELRAAARRADGARAAGRAVTVSLAWKKKEEEEERRRMVQEQVRARVDAEFAARHGSSSSTVKRRKRKKKRKKRLPRTCGRARHRQRQWHAPGWFFCVPFLRWQA